MATQQDVNQAIQAIDEVWANPPARNGLFGNALRSVSVDGIRGLSLDVELSWPVIAIGGINGCGKTTLLQLCSAAYTKHGTGRRHFTLGRWIGPSMDAIHETPPISENASVSYQFMDDTPTLDVRYQPDRTRWGYPRRGNPERDVDFVGIASFAPRIERTDRTHQNRSRLEVRASDDLSARVVESISRILGNTYESAQFHTVSAADAHWTDEIPQLARHGVAYTEAHMGAGEQKLVRLVRHLEGLPSKSLILLEEPELTLHPDAQFGLAWYLMTLSKRKGHQIVIATHSAYIFEALPRPARTVLTREAGSSAVLQRVSRLAAARQLSSSVRSNKSLIFVEDLVAKDFLCQIIDRYSDALRDGSSVIDVGSDDDVRRMLARFRVQGARAVGVRDPDVGEDEATGLFSLPGNMAPEQILLTQENVQRADALFSGFSRAVERASAQGVGYEGARRAKRVFQALCNEMQKSPEFISDRLVLAWLNDEANQDAARDLTERIVRALEED